jgi:hypothetical protein
MGETFRNTPVRIILTDDMGTITNWATPPNREDIESWVAVYADQGVDAVSWDFVGGQSCSYPSKVLDLSCIAPGGVPSQGCKNIRHMVDTGLDVVAVVAEASHRRGLLFWPAVRMNASARYESQTHRDHPEWIMTGIGRPMLNYGLAEVRAHMLRAFRELVEDYDADGLLLNFVRYPEVFHPDRAFASMEVLTRYMGQIRSMLNEVGARKDRKLTLAVQALSTPSRGVPYGHDVRAWIRNGYLDYVLPSTSNNTDCNLPVDLWMEIVSGTDCKVMPTIHPNFRFPWTVENRSTLETLRAAAHLYYRQGAHGLSTMNMFDALQNQWFKELRDPAKVARAPHHYRYTFNEGGTQSWTNGHSSLGLRTDNITWRVTTPIRIVDDPARMTEGKLRLTVENLKEESELTLFLNGEVIPRIKSAGRDHYPVYRSGKENISQIELPLSQLKLVRGVNQLGISLESARPYSEGWVTVREVELLVGQLGS